MRILHLGDVIDCWKGRMIENILPLLRELHIVPMITDARWSTAAIDLYGKMLGIPSSHILHKFVHFPPENRSNYFTIALNKRSINFDLFIDPNTGIHRARTADIRALWPDHITTYEINVLLPESSSRIVVIYRHQGHNEVASLLQQNLSSLQDRYLSSCHLFGVSGVAAGLVFVSRDRPRLKRMHTHLTRWFGTQRNDRVTALLSSPPSAP